MKAYSYIITMVITITVLSCKKQDEWLDIKQNIGDIVPKTLSDFEALLNNQTFYTKHPALGLVASDNYYVNVNTWQASSSFPTQKNSYVWATDIFQNESSEDWTSSYEKIMYANAILDGLKKNAVDGVNQAKYNYIKGASLFFRALTFYELAQTFTKPYKENENINELGVVLRLSADVSQPSTRATIKNTYDRIISDLNEAQQLLPNNVTNQLQVSKRSAQALLAKVFLSMDDFDKAFEYADMALNGYHILLDLNSLPLPSQFQVSFPAFGKNPEILFYAERNNSFGFVRPFLGGNIDSTLLQAYDSNDLRKTFFYVNYNGTVTFKGSYTGSFNSGFSGIATNELVLIKAECAARKGDLTTAIDEINDLLAHRYKTGTYTKFVAPDANVALTKILLERRKELPYTGILRWEDLRRLNRDSRFSKTLLRKLGSETFTLAPGDNKYAFPIPPDEIRLSGIQQNPR